MRKILAICSFEILRLLKKPQSYIIMFAMPLLFTLIFGSLMGESSGQSKPEFIIVDEDQSLLSDVLATEIGKSNVLESSIMSYEEAMLSLEDKKVEGLIQIQAGFEHSVITNDIPVVSLQHTPEFMNVMSVSQIINDAIAKVRIQGIGSELWSQYTGEDWSNMFTKVSTEGNRVVEDSATQIFALTRKNEEKSIENIPARAAGFSIMFVMMVMMSVTGTMLEAKKSGVWYRLLSSPISRFQLMAGYLLSFFLIGWIQFGVLMTASHLLFDIVWGNIIGNFLLVSALLVCVVGLGLFIAGLSQTVEQQAAIGNIVVVSSCMIGGVYWPLEIVPTFMKKLAEFVPQTWALRGFEELIARGGGVTDILLPIGVLLLFSVLFLSIGITRIRYE